MYGVSLERSNIGFHITYLIVNVCRLVFFFSDSCAPQPAHKIPDNFTVSIVSHYCL